MPVSKPSNLYRWATAVGALLSAPSSAKQDAGWVAEELPADWLNWLFNGAYLWFAYLNDLTNQVITWTANHTFNAAVSIFGNLAVAGATALGAVTTGSLTSSGINCTGAASVGGTLTLAHDPALPVRAGVAITSFSNGYTAAVGLGARVFALPGGEVALTGALTSAGTPASGLQAFQVPAGYEPHDDVLIPVETTFLGASGGSPYSVRARLHVTTGGVASFDLISDGATMTIPNATTFYLGSVRWNTQA